MDTENGIAVKDAAVVLGVGVGAVVAVIEMLYSSIPLVICGLIMAIAVSIKAEYNSLHVLIPDVPAFAVEALSASFKIPNANNFFKIFIRKFFSPRYTHSSTKTLNIANFIQI